MKPIKELLQQLTIPEKAALLEGFESWMTNAVPRLDIPAIYLTDGPLGLRKKADEKGEGSLGLGKSCPSTAFPASVNIANSWNRENARRIGIIKRFIVSLQFSHRSLPPSVFPVYTQSTILRL